jgi:selenocysteine lyase/cysteine desulfurase
MDKQMFSPALLEQIRDRFVYVDQDPHSGQRVYLEASGGSLRLKSVVETMTKEVSLPDELYRYNPASDYVVEATQKGIEDVKLFLGARSGNIISANSATQTIFRAVNAVVSHIPGSNIVTSQLEHPAVLSPTKYYAELSGKEWRVANIIRETGTVPMEAILEKIDKNTCMLCLQHASNQTGAVNDVKTLVREARKIKPDLYVLIDAVQYAPPRKSFTEAGYELGVGFSTACHVCGLVGRCRLSVLAWRPVHGFNRQARADRRLEKSHQPAYAGAFGPGASWNGRS